MTVQLKGPAKASTSKKALQEALNAAPDGVCFHDPSIIKPRTFYGNDIQPGESFPIVMDPQTRRRFATVRRTSEGSFRVG